VGSFKAGRVTDPRPLYLQNREEVDAYLARERQYAAEMRQKNEVPGIRERLLARRANAKKE
jgi:hypothetical protein